jgi:SAM-dependent methyltransferase
MVPIIPRVARSAPIPVYREVAHEIDASVTPTLDVGCGNAKIPGALGIDAVAGTQADVVHDLNRLPWPVPDAAFDVIRLWSVLEHLDDTLAVLAEVHRVARPDALVIIGVPHFSSANAYTDPTHRHHFSGRFLDYLVPGTELFEHFGFYGSVRFAMLERRVTLSPFWARLRLTRLLNRHLQLYETYLCYLVRGADIQLKLRVIK